MRFILLFLIFLVLDCSNTYFKPDSKNTPCADSKIVEKNNSDAAYEIGNTLPPSGKQDSGENNSSCEPNKTFCDGSQIKMCLSSGIDSILVTDCKSMDFATVTYSCETCQTQYPTCVTVQPLFSGSASGVATFSYQYHSSMCNEAGTTVATNFWGQGGSLSHTVGISSIQTGLLVSAFPSDIPSGLTIPLYADGFNPPVNVVVTKNYSTRCYNIGTSKPPSNGIATLTYSGKTKGSTMSIAISGYLTCDTGNTWQKFDYNANGVIF